MKAFSGICGALIATGAAVALSLSATAQTIPPCSTGGAGGAIPAAGSGGGAGTVFPTVLPPSPSVFTISATTTAGSTCVTAVTLKGLTHTWSGDVQFVLEDPSLVKHNLFCRPGATTTTNFSCDFSGDYTIVNACTGGLGMPATCSGTSVLAPGTYSQYFGGWTGAAGIANTPLSSIAAPAGTNTWTLYVYDWAGGDTGVLTSFEMCFGTPPPPAGAPSSAPALTSPNNGSSFASGPVTLTWAPAACATTYDVDVDGTVFSGIGTTSYSATVGIGVHTWTVRGANGMGAGPYATTRTFEVKGPPPDSSCVAGDIVGGIVPASGTGGTGSTWPGTLPATPFASTASVTTPAGSTKIVGVTIHGLNHTFVGDLQFVLDDPSGARHNLLHRPGFTGTGFGSGCDLLTGDYTIYETYGQPIETGCTTNIAPGNYEQSFGTGGGLWTNTAVILNTPLESVPVLAGTNSWTLTIYDWAGGDVGSITGWDLCFDSNPVTVVDCQILPTVTQTCDSVASSTGTPSATAGSGFTTTFGSLNAQVNGVVFYGINGPNNVPWSAQSNLCVKAPTVRLGGVPGASGLTGGVIGNCDGQYSFDANAVILAAAIPQNTNMILQGWQRDPASTKTTNLTDALSFVVGP